MQSQSVHLWHSSIITANLTATVNWWILEKWLPSPTSIAFIGHTSETQDNKIEIVEVKKKCIILFFAEPCMNVHEIKLWKQNERHNRSAQKQTTVYQWILPFEAHSCLIMQSWKVNHEEIKWSDGLSKSIKSLSIDDEKGGDGNLLSGNTHILSH